MDSDQNLIKKYREVLIFDNEFLRVILNSIKSELEIVSQEITSLLILYECFVFVYTPELHNDDDLKLCFTGINNVDVTKIPLNFSHCFHELVRIAYERKMNHDCEALALMIHHFEVNSTMDKSYYSVMINIFKDVLNTSSHKLIEKMYSVIFTALDNSWPIVDYEKLKDLVLVLRPGIATLNRSVLMSLGFLSNKSNHEILLDAYLQLPPALVQTFAVDSSIREQTQQPQDSYEVSSELEMGFFDSGLPLDFGSLPYDILEKKKCLEDIIGDERKELVLNVIAFMKMCSASAREVFVTTSLPLMLAVSRHDVYVDVMAAYLWIFRETMTKDSIQMVLPSVCKSGILSDFETVFSETPITVETNSVRCALVDWIADIAPEFVLIMLECCNMGIYITTELFIRILEKEDNFDMRILCHDKPIELMFNLNRIMMKMEASPPVQKCRTALFTVIHRLMERGFMINNTFASSFLSNVFDRRLTDHIIITWRNHMSTVTDEQEASNCFQYIGKLYNFCLAKKEGELAVEISNATLDWLRCNGRHIQFFYRHLSTILDISRETMNRTLLINAVTLLALMSMSDRLFQWELATEKKIVELIDLFDQEEPGQDIQNLLFVILSGSLSRQSLFLVSQPRALPMIMAVFGRSKRLKQILNRFEDLVGYSYHNAIKMSEGWVDLILMKYLNGHNVITLSDYISFRFCGDKEQCQRVFREISMIKSSSAVLEEMITHLDSQEKAEFCVHLLSQARHVGLTATFPLGVVPPNATVSGITAKTLNSGFSLQFTMVLDPALLFLAKYGTNIVSWIDSEENELKLTLDKTVLSCQLISQGLKTTVKIIKNLTLKAELNITMTFNMSRETLRISTCVNNRIENDSDLCPFNFADGPVRMVIGGFGDDHTLLPDEPFQASCFLYNIRLYDRWWDVHTPTVHDFNDAQLLSTSEFPESMLQTLEHTSWKESFARSVVIDVHESLGSPENILRTAIRSNVINQIVDKCLVTGVFAVVEFLFSVHEEVQRQFSSLDTIVALLTTSDVNYFWYYQLYHVLCSITVPQLQVDWLERLILNLWIWKKCEPCDLKLILRHWISVVLRAFTGVFEEKQYLSRFIHQFRLYFDVVISDGAIEQSVECLGGILGSTFSKSDLIECRDLFLEFLRRVAVISCTELDLVVLFMHIKNCQSKDVLLCLLSFVRDIAHHFTSDKFCSDLSSLICGDLDIDESVIITIHEIAGGNAYRRLLALRSSVTSRELFDRLLNRMKDFPDLLPLLCVTSLTMKCHEQVIETIKNYANALVGKVNNNRDWFCYLFMIAFNIEGDKIELDVCRVVVMLMKQEHMKSIGAFLNMVTYAAPTLRPNIVFTFVKVCVEGLKTSILWEMCFNYSMFHFFTNCFHQFVLDALTLEGCVADFELETPPVLLQNVCTLEDLRALADISLSNFDIRFEYRLSPDGSEWLDREMATLATRWVPRGTEYDIFLFVTSYFTEKSTVPDDVLMRLEMDLDEFLQKRCCLYQSETKENLDALFNTLRQNLCDDDTNRKIPHSGNEWDRMMKAEYSKISRVVGKPTVTFVTDNTACIQCTPMKLKRSPSQSSKRVSMSLSYVHPICQYSCVRVKKTCATTVKFILLKDSFVIDRSVTPLSSIRILLTRKRSSGETAIEIWTTDGKSMLLDFAPVMASKIIKEFGKVELKHLSLKQIQKSSALLQECYSTYFWQTRALSNFDYIMMLNIISGRSYNDKSLYPIFPAVLQNFSLESLSPMSFPSSDLTPLMDGLASTCTILSPEYYYSPSVFENDYEFVYKHRKILESEKVSERLPLFFDRFFGCGMKDDFPHQKLFSKPHCTKAPLSSGTVASKTLYLLKKRHIVYASAVSVQPTEISVNVITDDRSSIILKFSMEQDITASETQVSKGLSGVNGIISSFQQYTLIFEREFLRATVLKQGKVDSIWKLSSETNLVSCCDFGWVLWCPNDSAVWKKTDSAVRMLCRTTSPILSIVVNPLFKMFAVSTLDGFASVYSLRSGAVVKQTKFEEEIVRMVVTNKFGFILVFTASSVSLLSVNGDLIKKVLFGHRVRQTFLFSSGSDLDYVAFETEEHEVGFFEAFYPENVVFLPGRFEGIVWLSYVEVKKAFLLLSRAGALSVVPQIIDINCV